MNRQPLLRSLAANKTIAPTRASRTIPPCRANLASTFYADAPVMDDDGFIVGSLCVIERKLRSSTRAKR